MIAQDHQTKLDGVSGALRSADHAFVRASPDGPCLHGRPSIGARRSGSCGIVAGQHGEVGLPSYAARLFDDGLGTSAKTIDKEEVRDAVGALVTSRPKGERQGPAPGKRSPVCSAQPPPPASAETGPHAPVITVTRLDWRSGSQMIFALTSFGSPLQAAVTAA